MTSLGTKTKVSYSIQEIEGIANDDIKKRGVSKVHEGHVGN